MIANLYPQLRWLARQAEPVPQNAPDVIGVASSPDQRQSNAISLDLDAVRQAMDRIATIATSIASSQEQMTSSADRIATSQQQIARSLDQFTADQEQMTREITKLREIEQSNSSRNSEPSARPVVASAPQPISRPASAPAVKPVSRPPSASKPKPPFAGIAGTDRALTAAPGPRFVGASAAPGALPACSCNCFASPGSPRRPEAAMFKLGGRTPRESGAGSLAGGVGCQATGRRSQMMPDRFLGRS
jgi:hypothetical protein